MKTLQIGQKVQIVFKNDRGENLQIICDIKEILEDSLVLNYPDNFMQFAEFLEEGTEIQANIFAGPHIKVLDSIILAEPHNSTIEIDFPEDYETIQRRAYIRENLEYPITIKNEQQCIEATTLDMGGGGFRFKTDQHIEPDAFVHISICLNEHKAMLECIGKVSRKDHFPEGEYLVEFIEISENDRNKIIQKCIQAQTKKIREQQ